MIDDGTQPQGAADAPRIHHQRVPDEVFAKHYALPPDMVKILQGMGHKITQQTPWGAEVVELPHDSGGGGTASSGNDSIFGGQLKPGFVCGANDTRRPAALAAAGE